MARQWQQRELGGLALLAAGFILISMSLGGFALGWGIDAVFHTGYWGKLIGLLAGTIIGFLDLYRVAVRVMNLQPVPEKASSDFSEKSDEAAGDDASRPE